MTSSLKNTRGRHSLRQYNPHNIENLLSSSATSTRDIPIIKLTDSSSSNSIVNQSHAEPVVLMPSLSQSMDVPNVMTSNSMNKDIQQGHITDKLLTIPSSDATADKTLNSTTNISPVSVKQGSDVQTEDIGNNPPKTMSDSTAYTVGSLSPLFPNLTGQEDSKLSQQEDKPPVSSAQAILLSLTTNWSSIVATILGRCLPSCGENPRGIPSDSDIKVEYNSQACDFFIQDMLYNCDYAVVESIADTIINQLNEGFAVNSWTLDDVLQLEDETVAVTENNVALIVSKKFLHSLVRLLAIELSDPVIEGEETNKRTNRTKNMIGLIQ